MLVRTGAARRGLLMLVGCVLAIAGAATRAHSGSAAPSRPTAAAKTCPPGYVDALLSWGEKCLHGGQFCKVRNPEYHAYGFDCPTDGHLVELAQPTTTTTTTTATAPAAVPLGRTVRLAARRRADGCKRGALPDRRCSPGAIYGGLTKTVICSASFRTSSVRNVPQ
jgi:hypothetical protein